MNTGSMVMGGVFLGDIAGFVWRAGLFQGDILKRPARHASNWGAQKRLNLFLYMCSELRDVLCMAESRGLSESKRRGLGRWFPTVADAAAGLVGEKQLETLEILTDMEQLSDMFASFEDVRRGHIVNMSDAFGDL